MLENLGIDWKLLFFQIVNFLILTIILKKVLYKPVLNYLENRRKKIMDGLAKSEKFEDEWRRFQNIQKDKMSEIEKKAAQILEKARADAEKKEKEMMESSRQKSDKLLEEAKKEIFQEKEKVLDELKKEMANFIVFAAEKILKRAISAHDEKKMAEETIEILRKNK